VNKERLNLDQFKRNGCWIVSKYSSDDAFYDLSTANGYIDEIDIDFIPSKIMFTLEVHGLQFADEDVCWEFFGKLEKQTEEQKITDDMLLPMMKIKYIKHAPSSHQCDEEPFEVTLKLSSFKKMYHNMMNEIPTNITSRVNRRFDF
jgi:DNA-binding MltR family transcriptional regulator